MKKIKIKIKNKNKKGYLIWLTGFSGSGKSTIAKKIIANLEKEIGPTLLINGDDIRKIFELNSFDYVRLAVDGLQARYMAATDQEPRLIGGRSSRGSSNDVFESNAQLVEAMNDPRYSRDSAYRKKVADKLGRSNIL